jgi:hypothetical protein
MKFKSIDLDSRRELDEFLTKDKKTILIRKILLRDGRYLLFFYEDNIPGIEKNDRFADLEV